MTEAIAHGTSTSHGDTHTLRFALYLPYAAARVWGEVATPVGLRQWLAAADVFESRLGGRITLRGPGVPDAATGTGVPDAATGTGVPEQAAGTVTAWDGEQVVEYTFAGHGRIRFHLESVGAEATVVRFTHEFTGPEARCPEALACWHEHFELLHDALAGRPGLPADGPDGPDGSGGSGGPDGPDGPDRPAAPAGNPERRQELRAAYRPRGGRHS
ncbi:hypothetical protein [Streptomyces sp. NPDC059398]|uniref:hypothetical protein n=1 Tax=Streptomyces sp. NPDC059398 TaxID=3346820 RepID=UPI0036BE1443